jgi:hypothetical protein
LHRPEENIVRAFDKYITKRETATGAALSSLLLSNLLIISLIVLIIL